MTRCKTFAAVVWLALASGIAQVQAALYQLTDLGILSGSANSRALAISDVGHVTGDSDDKAFLWTPANGMQELGLPSGYTSPQGVGINNNDQIAVTAAKYDFQRQGFIDRAFRWTAGTYQDMGTLGGTDSIATGIDASGRLTGYAYTGHSVHAFRSTTGTSLTDIDSLGGGYSLGYAINASGQIVGQAYNAAHQYHAFRWNGSGSMIDLGVLGGTASQSEAHGISDSGIVVGISTTATLGSHAFLRIGNTMTDLGPEGQLSKAQAVNDSSQVVGTYRDGSRWFPYVWDPVNGMRSISSLIDPASGSGWTINEVIDINNPGQIVGNGTFNGKVHAILLTPVPEPGVCTLAILIPTVLRRRR